METYGEKLAEEIRVKFNLTNQATEQIARNIDKVITEGIKLDSWLRTSPFEKKKFRSTKIQMEKRKTETIVKKELEVQAEEKLHTNPDVLELSELRRELRNVMKHDFPGRIYSQETSKKIKRLKELEKIFL
jgi:hypothetical protein